MFLLCKFLNLVRYTLVGYLVFIRLTESTHTFTGPRCLAFCLETVFPKIALEECARIAPCAELCLEVCLRAAEDSNDPICNKSLCDSMGSKYTSELSTGCNEVCSFAESIHTTKPGHCPPTLDLVDPYVYGSSCVSKCNKDTECSGSLKCCLTVPTVASRFTADCFDCKDSILAQYELPPLVSSENLKVTENLDLNAFELSWRSWEPVGMNRKVIFEVRQKNVTGLYPKPEQLSVQTWNVVGITDSTNMTVMTKLGWWSEFQVATINQFGSKGYQKKSSVVKRLSRDPRPPEVPKSVITAITQSETNEIRVNNVSWMQPDSPDLPIRFYSVSFSCNFGPSLDKVFKYPSDKLCRFGFCFLSVTSNNLFQCSPTRFFVTVTAHCDNWGEVPVNSSKVSRELLVEIKSQLHYLDMDLDNGDEKGSLGVQIDYSKFSPNFVTVTVKWIPPVGKEKLKYALNLVRGFCNTAKSNWIGESDREKSASFNSSGRKSEATVTLDYECEYALQAQGIASKNYKDTYTRRYFTPSCDETAIISRVDLQLCRKTEQNLNGVWFPVGKIEDLNYVFVGKNTTTMTVNAMASWTFDKSHYDIITKEDTKYLFSPVVEIFVYKIHDVIGIIDLQVQPCSIYLEGIRDPQSGVSVLPNRVQLLDPSLQRPCLLFHGSKYRFAARVVYNFESSGSFVTEVGGSWTSVVLDTTVISFFDIFPPWKQEYFQSIGISTYQEALKFEQNQKPKVVKERPRNLDYIILENPEKLVSEDYFAGSEVVYVIVEASAIRFNLYRFLIFLIPISKLFIFY